MRVTRNEVESILMLFLVMIPGTFTVLFIGNQIGMFPRFELSGSFLRAYLISATFFCSLVSILFLLVNRSSSKYI
ncbi:hypothetical protein SAMN04488063_2295 [Halopelagius inordinatus]|uniref:Uncharacterized protein n=1 Tax=Halopelagius inordinatus TaxID=553467 RepID=A0A1I2SHA9_9EURY|nr:hypothetical protein SAMN04488063_2295 [Halopelagius inordinatus]